jgi:hypothetical protein
VAKELSPGELVIGTKSMGSPQVFGVLWLVGLVVSIDYPRPGDHIGCEERVRVMWCGTSKFDVVCDCELVRASDF